MKNPLLSFWLLLFCLILSLARPGRAADATAGAPFDAWFLAPSSANLANLITGETGTGAAVFNNSPALVAPDLGTPSAVGLVNGTGLPVATGISGLGTGVGTVLATPTSANLAAAITNETGSGALVFGTSPTLVAPALGTPSGVVLTNGTGLPLSALLQTAATSGQIIVWNGTNWAPAAGGSFSEAGNYNPSGTWTFSGTVDLSGATVTLPTFTTINVTNLAATNFTLGGTALTASGAEVNFTDGVTGAIQPQLDGKAAATSGTLTTPTITGPTFTEAAIASLNIDWATATTFTKTLAANSTFTFSNLANGRTINVALTNTASNYTVTWPTVSWSGGTAPTQTVGAKTDIYTFIRINGTVYGSVVGNF